MDASERAKRTAKKAKSNTSESTTQQTDSSFTGGFKNINVSSIIPDLSLNSSPVTPVTTISDNIDFDMNSGSIAVDIPGLPAFDINGFGNLLKTTIIKPIDDVTNPGFSADEKCNQSKFDKAVNDYEDAIRYQQLLVWANKYHGEQFKVIASQAKAYQQGLITAQEIEKVYQQFIELQKQQKITTEKGIQYIAQSHKTAVAQAGLPYTLADNEAKLESSRIKAKQSFEQARLDNETFQDWLASKRGDDYQAQ